MGTGFAKKKKQARELQQQLGKMQEQMQTIEAKGSSGNGLVTITVNGDKEIKSVKIKPECVDPEDVEGLEDLIKAAYGDAVRQLPAPEGLPLNFPGLGGF